MAEIKSTMEMVMEKAARMGKASREDMAGEEKVREGMRLAAQYLREEGLDMIKALEGHPEADRASLRKGLVKTLLRNIMLPREQEQQQAAEKAMQGLLAVGRDFRDLKAVLGELKTILEQYLPHRQQLREQLEASFAQQMEQMEQNLAQQTGMATKLQPSQHPKFQEEWQRLQAELNDQYGRVLEQHKGLLEQKLGG